MLSTLCYRFSPPRCASSSAPILLSTLCYRFVANGVRRRLPPGIGDFQLFAIDSKAEVVASAKDKEKIIFQLFAIDSAVVAVAPCPM